MTLRRTFVVLVVAALGLAACGGSDDAGIEVDQPIGAPDPEPAVDAPPSVAKSARVEMQVARADVSAAAQAVVDVVTSPKIAGYLTSSIVDLEDGYGTASVLVQVPAQSFEQAVVELGRIGEVRRQEMTGEQLAGPGMSRTERAAVAREASLAPIDVSIAAKAPPPARPETAIEQALGTAADIALATTSGVIVAAGAVIPVATVALAAFLLWSLVVRRLRVRWEGRAG